MNEQEKREHIMKWIIARAWEIMQDDERSEVEEWKSYVRQHAPDVFTSWGSMMK